MIQLSPLHTVLNIAAKPNPNNIDVTYFPVFEFKNREKCIFIIWNNIILKFYTPFFNII